MTFVTGAKRMLVCTNIRVYQGCPTGRERVRQVAAYAGAPAPLKDELRMCVAINEGRWDSSGTAATMRLRTRSMI
eukprot:732717-Prorocentrum_minimum.AAC.4